MLSRTPVINDRVARGMAMEQMENAVSEIDATICSIRGSFPEGFEYVGYKICDPRTEFLETTRQREGNKRKVELSRNSFILIRLDFTLRGLPLRPAYTYVPFMEEDGSIMYIRHKRYSIHAVLADAAFSIGVDSVFVPLNKKRLNFERTSQHFYMNGVIQSTYVVWSWVHTSAKRKSTTKSVIYSTMAHYLFSKYGVTETFKEFASADVVVGGDEIHAGTYPDAEWAIFQSTGIQPRAGRDEKYAVCKPGAYTKTRLRIAIPKSQLNDTVMSIVGGFFYIVDRFPLKIEAEHVDDTTLWKLLLGIIINGPGASSGLLINEIENHLQSITEYVDNIDKKNLSNAGLPNCNDIYELFAHIMELLGHQQHNRNRRLSNLVGKHLVTLRYALFDTIREINYLMFTLRNAQHKKQELTEQDYNNMLQKHIKPSTSFKMTNGHGEITTISTASDNMYVGITSTMVPQENADPMSGEKSRITLSDPVRHLDSSLPLVATYNAVRKSDPTGLDVINLFVNVSPGGKILSSPQHEEQLAKTQHEIWS
jgi:hypothetical protein